MDVIRALIHPWALGLAYILVRLEKGAAARSLSLRFSHRFQRIAKAKLILYQPSADDLGSFSVKSTFSVSVLRCFQESF